MLLHRSARRFLRATAITAVAVSSLDSAAAQCATQWLPGHGAPGVDNAVGASTMWDPDGAGPAVPQLVVAGFFTNAGGLAANRIATCDLTTGIWSTLGAGLNDIVYALATLPNGDLVAGGSFLAAGGVPAAKVARWDGTAWQPLGAGIDGGTGVQALATLPNGDLVAGGNFTIAGGTPASNIARWDGAAWHPFGSGCNNTVGALLAMPNGDVLAGGAFTIAGGSAASRIAKWNGSTWQPLGSGMSGYLQPWGEASHISALAALANGDVVAGGGFLQAGGSPASHVARWDGIAWHPLGTGRPLPVYRVGILSTGDPVVGNLASGTVVSWNGATWQNLGSSLTGTNYPSVRTLTALPNGELVAGGTFLQSAGIAAHNVARWDGMAWRSLSQGFSHSVLALARLPDGAIAVGGYFLATPGGAANGIARFDGTSWRALGAGVAGSYSGTVAAIAVLPQGDLVAGGSFSSAGGVAANNIARWDGTAWHSLGTGILGAVTALTVLPNGDLVAGGQFSNAGGVPVSAVARWDGMAWHALGSGISGTNPTVHSLATTANGDVVAGGYFTSAGGVAASNIARWNGSSWNPLGAGTTGMVRSLLVLANGDIVAGGSLATPAWAWAGVLRWDGSSWLGFGPGLVGEVTALLILPNGDLVAGGPSDMSTPGLAPNGLFRWNGSAWSAFGSGVVGRVYAMATLANGDLAVGGNIASAGGNPSAAFAQLTTTCPATVAPIATMCVGSTGPASLVAETLPWVGSTFRSRASGFGSSALAASVFGLSQPNTALSLLHPAGLTGCNLLASPDAVLLLLPIAGASSAQCSLANDPSLAGVQVFHQFLQLEVVAGGGALALSGSNGLMLTVGVF